MTWDYKGDAIRQAREVVAELQARLAACEQEREKYRQSNAELTALGIDREIVIEDARARLATFKAEHAEALVENSKLKAGMWEGWKAVDYDPTAEARLAKAEEVLRQIADEGYGSGYKGLVQLARAYFAETDPPEQDPSKRWPEDMP